MGFLYADGNVSTNSYHISCDLHIDDIEHLSIINVDLMLNTSFYIYPKNKFIVNSDFKSSLFLLAKAIKGTEYE